MTLPVADAALAYRLSANSQPHTTRERQDAPLQCCVYLSLELGLAGQVDAQALEGLLVDCRQDHRGMDLAATELVQLLHGLFRCGVSGCTDGKGDQHFVGVQPGIVILRND